MTREQAIICLNRISNSLSKYCDVNDCIHGNCAKCYEALNMAIEALEQEPSKATGEWIPVKWHEITDEERDREGYPEDWAYFLDCEMPDDGERILVTTKNGFVELDECYCDGEYALESGDDWIGDVLAWTQLPDPHKGSEEE